jgi:hypothetical protein
MNKTSHKNILPLKKKKNHCKFRPSFSFSVWKPELCSLQSGVLGSIQDVASSSFYHLMEISTVATSSPLAMDTWRTGFHIATEVNMERFTLQPFCAGTMQVYHTARLPKSIVP